MTSFQKGGSGSNTLTNTIFVFSRRLIEPLSILLGFLTTVLCLVAIPHGVVVSTLQSFINSFTISLFFFLLFLLLSLPDVRHPFPLFFLTLMLTSLSFIFLFSVLLLLFFFFFFKFLCTPPSSLAWPLAIGPLAFPPLRVLCGSTQPCGVSWALHEPPGPGGAVRGGLQEL